MRFCLMDPRPFTWDRLVWMNRQWKGIVFMDFHEENAPHFILNLIEELQNEKISDSIAPCQTFSKSFMMISPATKRKDLVLLLRPLKEENMSRLEHWRNNQGEQIVMTLSDYVNQYVTEFTGIGQSVEVNDSKSNDSVNKPSEQKSGNKRSQKSKKGNKKRNNDIPSESPEEVNIDTGNETMTEEENATGDDLEVSDEGKESQ